MAAGIGEREIGWPRGERSCTCDEGRPAPTDHHTAEPQRLSRLIPPAKPRSRRPFRASRPASVERAARHRPSIGWPPALPSKCDLIPRVCGLGCRVVSLAGCVAHVQPPRVERGAQKVFLVDHGRHPSLVLPHGEGRAVRYAYGDWKWFAEADISAFSRRRGTALAHPGARAPCLGP